MWEVQNEVNSRVNSEVNSEVILRSILGPILGNLRKPQYLVFLSLKAAQRRVFSTTRPALNPDEERSTGGSLLPLTVGVSG